MTAHQNTPHDVDFGHKRVSADDKPALVNDVFQRVASNYDLMNDVMSLGLHRLWKDWFVAHLPQHTRGTYLDVACGSGDIIQRLAQRLPQATIIGSDINPAMLAQAQQRTDIPSTVNYLVADASALPLDDAHADVVSIVFGLRNVTKRQEALHEFYRVLKWGGCVAIMEFHLPTAPLPKMLFDFYGKHIMPAMGEHVAHDRAAYQYLAESIAHFPSSIQLQAMMEAAGFYVSKPQTMAAGLVIIHTGYKT